MDDLYCPRCRLVIPRRVIGQTVQRHCPRCLAQTRRRIVLLALDQLPPTEPSFEPTNASPQPQAPILRS
jgi:hypothetical protein